MDWFISILPEFITGIVSLLVGGFWGFKIGVNKKQKMIQKAGDNANQVQVGGDYTHVR